jgi:hypothetical protein
MSMAMVNLESSGADPSGPIRELKKTLANRRTARDDFFWLFEFWLETKYL